MAHPVGKVQSRAAQEQSTKECNRKSAAAQRKHTTCQVVLLRPRPLKQYMLGLRVYTVRPSRTGGGRHAPEKLYHVNCKLSIWSLAIWSDVFCMPVLGESKFQPSGASLSRRHSHGSVMLCDARDSRGRNGSTREELGLPKKPGARSTVPRESGHVARESYGVEAMSTAAMSFSEDHQRSPCRTDARSSSSETQSWQLAAVDKDSE